MGVGFWRCRGGGGTGRAGWPRRHSQAAMRGRGGGWVVGAPLAVRNRRFRCGVTADRASARNLPFTTSSYARGRIRRRCGTDTCGFFGCRGAPRCGGSVCIKNFGNRSIFGRTAARGVRGLRCPPRSPFPSPPLPTLPDLCFWPAQALGSVKRAPVRGLPVGEVWCGSG